MLPLRAHTFNRVAGRLTADSATFLEAPSAVLLPVWETAGQFTRVQRLRVEAGASVSYIFIKLFTPNSTDADEVARQRRYLASDYERTLQAQTALQSTPWLAVPQVLACFPDLFALVTREAPGERLDRLLKRFALVRTTAAKERISRALAQVGEWVKRFQVGVPVRDPLFQKDYARYLDDRLKMLVAARAGGFSERHRAAVLSMFEAHVARSRPGDLAQVAVHADLCPSNILVRDEGVTVLDLAMSTDRTKYLDVTHLHVHLMRAERRLRLGRKLAGEWQRALLRGFDPQLRTDEPLFRLMVLQHVICGLAAELDTTASGQLLRQWRMRRHIQCGFAMAGVALR
jgi:hypothetical protein